jgi:hypothetical protein
MLSTPLDDAYPFEKVLLDPVARDEGGTLKLTKCLLQALMWIVGGVGQRDMSILRIIPGWFI